MSDVFGTDDLKDLRQGKEQVFKRIFKSFYGKMLYYAMEFVPDKEVAKEIVQDAFLTLWEKKKTLSENTNIPSYLYVIIRNQCLNHLKRIKVESRFHNYSVEMARQNELNLAALEDEVSEKLIVSELEERVAEIIESLPDQCRRVFKMSRHEGLTYKQIADKLNISVKAVEGNISRALRQLYNGGRGTLYCCLFPPAVREHHLAIQ